MTTKNAGDGVRAGDARLRNRAEAYVQALECAEVISALDLSKVGRE
jgi:hypothetical protein